MDPCPICGSAARISEVVEGGFAYARCRTCTTLSLNPLPDPSAVRRWYCSDRGVTYHRAADIFRALERRAEARWRWSIVRRYIPRRGGAVLEVGCGAGYFLEQVRRSGRRAFGLELGEDDARFARSVLGLDVRVGTLEDRPFGYGRFDAVVLFEVLSHLRDPVATLREVRSLLAPGGVLILETGNAAEVPAGRRSALGAPEHIHHFGRRGVRILLDRAGFRIVGMISRCVEWQRAVLRLGAIRRRAGPFGGTAAAEVPAVRPWWKEAASLALLALRFEAGRIGADSRKSLTLFVAAQPCVIHATADRGPKA
jgi:SAM-dependent methyltransferase